MTIAAIGPVALDDPQNPVRFKLNALIPTELDKTKVNYGLAQGIADGPESRNLGGLVEAPQPTSPTQVPIAVSPSPASQFGKFEEAPQPTSPTVVPNIATKNPSSLFGGIIPPPPPPIATKLPPPTQPNGSVNLGGFLFVPEAGAKPENPA